MTSSECLHVAAQLDEHHAPDTNGRIPVCHMCGARTDSPIGEHHVMQEGRVDRSTEWLVAQSRLRDIAHSQMLRGIRPGRARVRPPPRSGSWPEQQRQAVTLLFKRGPLSPDRPRCRPAQPLVISIVAHAAQPPCVLAAFILVVARESEISPFGSASDAGSAGRGRPCFDLSCGALTLACCSPAYVGRRYRRWLFCSPRLRPRHLRAAVRLFSCRSFARIKRPQPDGPDLGSTAVTLVHSGEGREVMTRPLGPLKVSSLLALPVMVQPLAVHQMMVVLA